jgi:hypothetical protein
MVATDEWSDTGISDSRRPTGLELPKFRQVAQDFEPTISERHIRAAQIELLQLRHLGQMFQTFVRESRRAAKVKTCHVFESPKAFHRGVGHLAAGVQPGNPVLRHDAENRVPVLVRNALERFGIVASADQHNILRQTLEGMPTFGWAVL